MIFQAKKSNSFQKCHKVKQTESVFSCSRNSEFSVTAYLYCTSGERWEILGGLKRGILRLKVALIIA